MRLLLALVLLSAQLPLNTAGFKAPTSGGSTGGQAAVFDGSSQSAFALFPSGAPYASLGQFQVVFRMRNTGGQSGWMFRITNTVALSDIGSATYNLQDMRDGVSNFHNSTAPAGADLIWRIQYDPANSRWTSESWTPDGTNYVFETLAITTTSNFNVEGQQLNIMGNMFGGALESGEVDWMRVIARYQTPSSTCISATPPSGVTWLADLEFEGDWVDSEGATGTATTVGSPTFAPSDPQPCP